jgi:hypothetical protein
MATKGSSVGTLQVAECRGGTMVCRSAAAPMQHGRAGFEGPRRRRARIWAEGEVGECGAYARLPREAGVGPGADGPVKRAVVWRWCVFAARPDLRETTTEAAVTCRADALLSHPTNAPCRSLDLNEPRAPRSGSRRGAAARSEDCSPKDALTALATRNTVRSTNLRGLGGILKMPGGPLRYPPSPWV